MAVSPGTRVGPYEIIGLIGAGGMGEVYKAADTRLGRPVAVKFLDPVHAERFQREARAIAALNHPHICTLHDVGPDYLVMEYVEGKPLKGPTPPDQALRLALQIAAALEAAHRKGIVHRDLKPANILLTDSGAKLLDFGLAKIQHSEDSEFTQTQTQAGLIMGTAAYMSPEQAEGRPADVRSDIFSFGLVLYELLSGRRAFYGETAISTMAAILHKEPEPLDVPAPIGRIVARCLRKAPAERYQAMADLSADLRDAQVALTPPSAPSVDSHPVVDAGGPASVPVASPLRRFAWIGFAALALLSVFGVYRLTFRAGAIDSVAVLPFLNVGGSPDTEYLSEGISDSLINSLAQLPKLRVTARGLAFRHKGADVDPQKVGRDLKVKAVVTGRVQQRGDSLSVQVELMDVEAGAQLWGQQYNRRLADVIAVQEDIAREVSDKLRLRLTGDEQKRLTRRYTDNVEAYQAYLQGRFYLYRYTRTGMLRGIEFMNRAIELEPNYALAYAGLAEGYSMYSGFQLSSAEAMPKARAAAVRALEIDDRLAEAHSALGMAKHSFEWNWAEADREYRRAIELNPAYAAAHDWYGFYLALMGRSQEAIRELERAVELDPLSPAFRSDLGEVFRFARRYDEAIENQHKAIQLDPRFWLAHLLLAAAHANKGDFPAAYEEIGIARAIEDDHLISVLEAQILARGGQTDRARVLVRRLEDPARPADTAHGAFMAQIYGALGLNDRAFEWLEQSYRSREAFMPFLKVDPGFDPLRSDPRFADLLRRMRFPE